MVTVVVFASAEARYTHFIASFFTKSGTIAAVEKGKRYTISLKYTEKSGNIDLELVVDKSTDIIYDDIIFIPVSTGVAATGRFDIWAGHFTAYADVDESEYDASKVFFEYRKAGEESWTRKSAERQSEGFFSTPNLYDETRQFNSQA